MTSLRLPVSHRILPYLCLLYIPIAIAVAELQLATTYDVGEGKAIFSGYLADGQGAIFHARPLLRWLINTMTGLLHTTPEWANFWLHHGYHLRPSWAPVWGGRNMNRLCISYACRPRLSSRLTLRGLAWRRKP